MNKILVKFMPGKMHTLLVCPKCGATGYGYRICLNCYHEHRMDERISREDFLNLQRKNKLERILKKI